MKKKRTASQVGKMSRRKGKSFERWCARYFTQWTGLKWETTRNSGRTDLKGDIYCVSRPDLPLVVECKDNKQYSVHAMLKSTKAFVDMVECVLNKSPHPVLFVVKNETSIWVSWCASYESIWMKCPSADIDDPANTMCIDGMDWIKVDDVISFEIDGVDFKHAGRMDSTGKKSKG